MSLTAGQADVLGAVKAGHATAVAIAEAVDREPKSVRSMLLALNGKGLVRRNLQTSEWRIA